jgi:hypothetical protein
LFRAATDRGVLPSELSPRRNRAPLSRPLAPWRSSTDVLRRARPSLVTAGFIDSRARAQSPESPVDYGNRFRAPEGPLPRFPGLDRAEPSRSASFTRFEALFPLRVRSHQSELPRSWRPVLSWAFSSLESTPPSLGSSTRPSPRARARCLPREVGGATRRTLQPSAPGETSPMQRVT